MLRTHDMKTTQYMYMHMLQHACSIAQIVIMKVAVPDQSASFGAWNDLRSWRMTSDTEDTGRRKAFLPYVFSGGSLSFQVEKMLYHIQDTGERKTKSFLRRCLATNSQIFVTTVILFTNFIQ